MVSKEKKSSRLKEDSARIPVSIIIPCYNEERFLPLLFDTLEEIDTEGIKYEVIVVDNGSTDNSVEISNRYGAKVLVAPEVNIGSLRNIGAKCSQGDLLAFLDADCLPSVRWLVEASKYMEKDDVGLFGCTPACPMDGTWVEKAWCSTTPRGAHDAAFVCSANMFVKRRVFFEINGFDEALSTGEDYDICQRVLKAGYRVVEDERIKVIHLRYPKTVRERFTKEIWYGEQMFKILKVKPLYKPFWASLIFGLSFIIMLVCLVFQIVGVATWAGLCIISLPCGAALHKVWQSKNRSYYFHLVFLFLVYFTGRFCSIVRNTFLIAYISHL